MLTVISTPEIIQPDLIVIDITAITEGLHSTKRADHAARLANRLASCIVSIRYHLGAIAVNRTNDDALQVVQVGIGTTVEDHHSRLILHIIHKLLRRNGGKS